MSKDIVTAEQYALNMKLWDAVKTTDPDHQRPVKYGKREFTTVDPQWQVQQATKLWGPYGDKWGLRDIKHEIIRMDGIGTDGPYVEYAIVLSAKFFYPSVSGEEASFEVMNDDKFSRGQETLKKLVTNTRSKALSWLGFSSDVFMGMYDDVDYVRDLQERSKEQNAMKDKMLAVIAAASSLEKLASVKQRVDVAIGNNKLRGVDDIQEVLDAIETKEVFLSFS